MKRSTIATLAACVAGLVVLIAASATNAASHRRVAASSSISHVVLVMEENHTAAQALAGMPYLKSVATTYGVATAMTADHFPSLPNYIELTSGSVPGGIAGKDCTPSSTCRDSGASIFSQVASWRVWAEGMPKPCDAQNSGEYVPRHTAGPYYTQIAAQCKTSDIALPSTPTVTAAFTLVAPNLIHDAHDGTLSQADAWLKTFLPKLTSQAAYVDGSTLVEVTFDSGAGNCGQDCSSSVLTVFINPAIHHVILAEKTTHCSILRLNEEVLRVPLLGCATSAPDIRSELGL